MSDRERQVFEMIERHPRLFKGAAPELGIITSLGWDGILQAIFHDFDVLLDDEQAKQFRFIQIKEELGCLRISYGVGESSDMDPVSQQSNLSYAFLRELLDALISDAAKKALRTCEQCGKPGVLRQARCMRVICDVCLRDDRCADEGRLGGASSTSKLSDEEIKLSEARLAELERETEKKRRPPS